MSVEIILKSFYDVNDEIFTKNPHYGPWNADKERLLDAAKDKVNETGSIQVSRYTDMRMLS